MPVSYFTYFDQNYALRGAALIESLLPFCRPEDQIIVLALDDETRRLISELFRERARVFTLPDLQDPELLALREVRPNREFCWSCAAAMSAAMLRTAEDGEYLVYLDADMMFFRDPKMLLDEFGNDGSMLIHEHRYSPDRVAWLLSSGRFNVGFIGMRAGAEARRCIERWRAQVIESCERDEEKGLCGDQGYLNEWPTLYPNLRIMQNIGGGVAPWNVNQYQVDRDRNGPTVDGTPIVFYHYHALKTLYDPTLNFVEIQPASGYEFSPQTHEYIYRPYVERLRRVAPRAMRAGFAIRFDKLIEPASDPERRSNPASGYQTVSARLRTAIAHGVRLRVLNPALASGTAPQQPMPMLGFGFRPTTLDSILWPAAQRVRARARGTAVGRHLDGALARLQRLADRRREGVTTDNELRRAAQIVNRGFRHRVESLGYALARASRWGLPQEALDLSGDRDVEWSWTVAHIPENPGRVLDFGPATSPTPVVAGFKADKVIALDLNPPTSLSIEVPNVYYIKGDILCDGLPESSFDTIINCSTTEHVGLSGRYGNTEDPDGDLKAMALLRARMAGPTARMIFTIPVGLDSVERPYHRIYGEERLPRILEGFAIVKEAYYAKPAPPNIWRNVNRAQALATRGSNSFYSLGLFVLKLA